MGRALLKWLELCPQHGSEITSTRSLVPVQRHLNQLPGNSYREQRLEVFAGAHFAAQSGTIQGIFLEKEGTSHVLMWDNEGTRLRCASVLFGSPKAAAAPYHCKETLSAPSRDGREAMIHSSSENPSKRGAKCLGHLQKSLI